jgi:hypothetical protein
MGSSGEGEIDISRCGRGGVGPSFEGGEAEAGGEGAGGKLVGFFAEVNGGMDGETASGVWCESLDDGFRC